MTEPTPTHIPLEAKKEFAGEHHVLTIQMTGDGSPGADVVKTGGG